MYYKNMARPRQWKKRFTHVHTELKAAHNNYVKRANVRRNAMAMSRWSKKTKQFQKHIGYGRHSLYSTKGIRTGFKKHKVNHYGGKKIWRRTPFGVWPKKYF